MEKQQRRYYQKTAAATAAIQADGNSEGFVFENKNGKLNKKAGKL